MGFVDRVALPHFLKMAPMGVGCRASKVMGVRTKTDAPRGRRNKQTKIPPAPFFLPRQDGGGTLKPGGNTA